MFGARTYTVESEKQKFLRLNQFDYAREVVKKLRVKKIEFLWVRIDLHTNIFTLQGVVDQMVQIEHKTIEFNLMELSNKRQKF